MAQAAPQNGNPFLGLTPFDRTNRDLFFGRERDGGLIQGRLVSSRTTLLFAGSGVGKSSFLNAKLIPDLEADYRVAYHNSWSGADPLDAVRVSCGGATGDREWWKRAFEGRRGLLVLDQFEELFQYHKDSAAVRRFADGIAEVINAGQPVDIRVLVAMREEFLGELSVFDSRVTDIFANYYRLRNPGEEQARQIIERTAEACGAPCDPEGLGALLADLRGILAKDGERPPDLVAPPYLQMVCHRIWRATAPGSRGGAFLLNYQPGQAAEELNAYCREKLDVLRPEEKGMVSDALGFLVGRGGAKRGYHLEELAELVGVKDAGALEAALRYLSSPGVRILRGPADGTATPWFELYHDMYAPFLSDWKAEYDRERKRQREELERQTREQQAELERQRREALEQEEALRLEKETRAKELEERQRLEERLQLEMKAAKASRQVRLFYGWTITLLVVLLAGYFTYWRPSRQYAALMNAVRNPDSDQPTLPGELHGSLSVLPYWRPKAGALWKQYWERRATIAALKGNTEDVLLYSLKRASLGPDEGAERQATALLDESFNNLVATYRAGASVEHVAYSQKRSEVIASRVGTILRWDAATGLPKPEIRIPYSDISGEMADNRERAPVIMGLSRDGRFALAAAAPAEPGNGVKWGLFDLDSPGAPKLIWPHESRFRPDLVSFSDSGRWMALSGRGKTDLCEVASQRCFPIDSGPTAAGAFGPRTQFSHDDSLLALTISSRLAVFDLRGRRKVADWPAVRIENFVFDGRNRVIAADYGRVKILDAQTGKDSEGLPRSTSGRLLGVLSDGRTLVTETEGGLLHFYDLEKNTPYEPQAVGGSPLELVPGPEPAVIAGVPGSDDTLRCWRLRLRPAKPVIAAMAWAVNRSGKLVATSDSKQVALVRAESGERVAAFDIPGVRRLGPWSDDDQALLIEVVPRFSQALMLPKGRVMPVRPRVALSDTFFANAEFLFYRGDDKCALVDTTTGVERWSLPGCVDMDASTFGARGATVTNTGQVQAWRALNGSWERDGAAFSVPGDPWSVLSGADGRRLMAWGGSRLDLLQSGKRYVHEFGDSRIDSAALGPGPELITVLGERLQILRKTDVAGKLEDILAGNGLGATARGGDLLSNSGAVVVARRPWYHWLFAAPGDSVRVVSRYNPLGGTPRLDPQDNAVMRFVYPLDANHIGFRMLRSDFADVSISKSTINNDWASLLHDWELRLGRRIGPDGRIAPLALTDGQ